MSDRLRWLWRNGGDWLTIISAAALIILIWLGAPTYRWEQTFWLVILISGYFQLQCYRRWPPQRPPMARRGPRTGTVVFGPMVKRVARWAAIVLAAAIFCLGLVVVVNLIVAWTS